MNPETNPIATLIWTFGSMSLFAVGGANSAIPEMHRFSVDVHHWMTDKQFADIFRYFPIVVRTQRVDGDFERLFGRGYLGRIGRNGCADRQPGVPIM